MSHTLGPLQGPLHLLPTQLPIRASTSPTSRPLTNPAHKPVWTRTRAISPHTEWLAKVTEVSFCVAYAPPQRVLPSTTALGAPEWGSDKANTHRDLDRDLGSPSRSACLSSATGRQGAWQEPWVRGGAPRGPQVAAEVSLLSLPEGRRPSRGCSISVVNETLPCILDVLLGRSDNSSRWTKQVAALWDFVVSPGRQPAGFSNGIC